MQENNVMMPIPLPTMDALIVWEMLVSFVPVLPLPAQSAEMVILISDNSVTIQIPLPTMDAQTV